MLHSPIYEYTPAGFVTIILLNTFLLNTAEKGMLNSYVSKAKKQSLISSSLEGFLVLSSQHYLKIEPAALISLQ